MNILKKASFIYTSALFIFIFAALFITFPLVFHLGQFTTGAGDELLIAWIHAWVIHALVTNPLAIFNANIYYPYPNSLAFSDLFITGSLLTAPFVYLLGQPIVANNITLISSLIFLGFFIFLLAYYLTKNYIVSILSGTLVIFSPATLSNAIQIQMLEIYWIPLAILFLLQFFERNKTRFLLGFLLCFLLQFYNSFLPAYFILFSSIIIFLFVFQIKRKKMNVYFTKKNILLVLLTFIFMVPLIIPYYQVSNEFHYTRDLRYSIHFAMQPEDFLYPGINTKLNTFLVQYIPTNHYSQNNEFKPGYLGVVFSLLILFILFIIFQKRKKLTTNEKIFLTIALVGLLLSFGPFLHLDRHTIHYPIPIPLPYLVFYYLLPGFQGFRNSQRWEMLFIIGIAIVISLVFNKMFKKISVKKKVISYLLVFTGIVLEFMPFSFMSLPQREHFPKVYSWMATTPPNSTFVMLPIFNWNMQPNIGQELYREYFSTVEFRPMVNGYSGFSPPPWQVFISSLNKEFPNHESIKKLRSIGVHYIIIDKLTYDKEHKLNGKTPTGKKITQDLMENNEFLFVKDIDNYSIFFIRNK